MRFNLSSKPSSETFQLILYCIYYWYFKVKRKVTSLNNTITHYKSLNRMNTRLSPVCKILSKSNILTVQFYFLNTPSNAQRTLRKSTNKQTPSLSTYTQQTNTPLWHDFRITALASVVLGTASISAIMRAKCKNSWRRHNIALFALRSSPISSFKRLFFREPFKWPSRSNFTLK